MSFVNNYVPPQPVPSVLPDSELYGPDPYDINFALPLHAESLENDCLRLTPFVPAVHAQIYWDVIEPLGSEPYRYCPWYCPTLPDFLTFVETRFRREPECILFALIDKTRADAAHPALGGSLAGIAALMKTSAANLFTEIAHIVVFPAFRHTHVARTMVGLLLRYLLELPRASPPGLGFRRVAWAAHPDNAPSLGLARSMGFRPEAHHRYMWILPDSLSAQGAKGREGDLYENKTSRPTVIWAICWDDWENGGRENALVKIAK